MRPTLCAALAGAALLAVPAAAGSYRHEAEQPAGAATETFLRQHGEALAGAINHPTRAEDRARDAYRHPEETLAFWQVAPDMKVGEYAPGGGWFSRLLGHYLGGEGELVGLFFSTSTAADAAGQDRLRAAAAKFPADVAGFTGLPADRFAAYTLDAVPADERGTFDRIIIARMMHNLHGRGIADTELRAMRDLLKDDGMIGVEQHRARADAPWSYANGSKGYMRQDDVIALMRLNGFELVGASEANANPRDPANHAEGVWEMPPILRTQREDLRGLGESDRMTLLFRKAR
ncbi:methyltransferase [Erythrobacteraceae bacterium CFH 75059]|uniref:class I SAM-dependent methyltransferase n=1 Tax=Qipengyuania thermophila TaxID=2509361 RepID=UPI0010211A6C|nr:class I SAM-dependent methyltransferase [Qipengyuania thermophila]TCD02067.1 methyltransferase [Erythrobacteraceae bacterium CFH 75059]